MSRAQQLKPGDVSLGQGYEFFKAFGKAGGSLALIQALIEGEGLMKWIVEGCTSKLEEKMSLLLQKQCPVHDARKVNELFSLGYTEEQLTAFGPPPDAISGYLTFFDPGWEILRLREYCKDKGRIFYGQNWYERQVFAKKQEEPRYRQIRIEAVEESFNKIFDKQVALLPDTEEVPLARQVLMGMVTHFLFTGVRLFEKYYVRCLDKVDYDGCPVYVGGFAGEGLRVDAGLGGDRDDYIGLASAKKILNRAA